jgi:hypothetical protein
MTEISALTKFPEAPTTTLSDLRRIARASKVHDVYVFAGTNLGRDTLTARMSIAEFYEMSAVGNRETVAKEEHAGEFVAQRKLIPGHAKDLALYVLRGLVVSAIASRQSSNRHIEPEIYRIRDDLAGGPYAALQPLVCNIRACKPGGGDLPMDFAAEQGQPFFRVSLASSQKLWVVDGQHRREAFGIVIKYLEDANKNNGYPKTKSSLYNPYTESSSGKFDETLSDFWREVYDLALQECSVTVEIHLGLGLLEEGQLFSDLNSKGKTLHTSLLAQFDKSDAIAALIGDHLTQGEDPVIRFSIKDDSDAKSWTSAGMTLKDVIMINRLLIHGNNAAKATPPSVVSEKRAFIDRFWTVVQSISGFGYENQRSKTVAGQPVTVKALAKLAFDHAYGVPRLRDEEGLRTVYDAIFNKELSFEHNNPLWRALFVNDETLPWD